MISPDQLAAYLDDALDDPAREAVERHLGQDAAALRFVLEQRQVDRVLGSLLAPATRRQRLKASVLAAIAAPSTDRLRAQVLADTSGRRARPAPPKPQFVGWWGAMQTWLDGLGGRFLSPGLARFAVAAAVLVLAVGGWFLFRPVSEARLVVGRFAVVIGQPTLQHGSGRPAFNPQPSTPVHLGDRLETGDADKAELVFLDGTTLRLGFNTTVELPTLNVKRSTSNVERLTFNTTPLRPPEVQLLRGQVWTKVQKTTNAPQYAIRTDAATAVARGTEFGIRLQRAVVPPDRPSAMGNRQSPSPLQAVLTVKEGAVDFFNAFGSVQATAMTESTARADAAPTEPKRLETLQTVQLDTGATWSLVTSPLDWPEAAEKLVGGGGSLGWQLREEKQTNGGVGIRVSRLPASSPAAKAGLRVGDAILALDAQPLTNARQLASAILLRPGGAVNLRVRRTAGEETVAVAVTSETNVLRGPDLPTAVTPQLTDLLRQWLATPADPVPHAGAEARRSGQATALSRSHDVRAAVFNQLGVAFELDDALGSAVRAYGRAVYLEPDIPLYRFNLGLALRKIGSFERALEEFEEAVRLEPDSIPARKRVAEVQSLLGHHTEALALTEKLLEAAPQDHGAWELKAQLLLKLQRPAEAVAPARLAAELDPDCPVAHGYLAEVLHASGQLAEAEAAYAEALDRAPFEAVFHVNLGTLQRDLRQSAAAEQSFRKAIELQPSFALAWYNLGELLLDDESPAAAASAVPPAFQPATGADKNVSGTDVSEPRPRRYDSAEAALRKAAELDPADPGPHRGLGHAALKRRDFAAAEADFLHALEIAPKDAEAFYGLGEVQRLQRRSADAERAYRRAIELRPNYAAAHTALGIVFYDRGDFDQAERFYRRAIELDPSEAAPYHNLGNLCREARGDLDAAERWFRQATELSPDDGQPLGGLALVAAQRGNRSEAERLLRRAIELDPDSSALHNNLGEILRQRGRQDEAEPLYRRALELDPDNPAPYGNLGIIQAERKQFVEAEKTFRALLERSRGNARLPAVVNLAMVCGEQGKLDEAEGLYRQALELAPGHPHVANGLAAFLADHERKLDEALALAKSAVQAQRDNPEFLDTLGWVQAQRGDLEAAERTLQRALDLAGQEPPVEEIRKHLDQVRAMRLSPKTQDTPAKP